MLKHTANAMTPTGNHKGSGTTMQIVQNPVFMKKARKNDLFFGIMQKITTFACLFGEKP